MKATIYEMICTNNITGEKMKCKVTVEAGHSQDEAIGEVQNNFLWETFDFDMKKIGDVVLDFDEPLTTYSDVEAI
jgi:membrane protein required for beta-lactamase induction